MKDALRAAVRNTSRKTEGWTQRRNEAIRAAYAAGVSLRELAEDASLSHMTIKRIIERDQP